MAAPALAGTAALVTGGAGGIGLGAARMLAGEGAAVVLMGRTPATLEAAAHELRAEHPHASVSIAVGDAADEHAVRAAMAEANAAAPDGLATVIAVIGGSVVRALVDVDEVTFTAQLRDNVLPAFLAVRHATPHLAARGGGCIVCIGSVAAAIPYPYLTPYGAAKAAVEGLVRGAALELAPLGVRVHAVRPGPVRTGAATAHLASDDPAVRRHVASRPIARVGHPDDVAAAIRLLVTPAGAWMTGQCISIDGGTELAGAPAYLRNLVTGPPSAGRSPADDQGIRPAWR